MHILENHESEDLSMHAMRFMFCPPGSLFVCTIRKLEVGFVLSCSLIRLSYFFLGIKILVIVLYCRVHLFLLNNNEWFFR